MAENGLPTEEEIKLEARLMAIEHMLTKLYASHYLAKGYSLDLIRSMHKLQLGRAREETFPNANPALSDHVSGEFEIQLERLHNAVSEMVESAQAQSK
jgi:hypothetical protein